MEPKIDRDDAESLCGHIEGHLVFMREAIAAGDGARILDQATEIEGWCEALKEIAQGKGGDAG